MLENDFLIEGPAGRIAVRAKGLDAAPSQAVVCVQGANLSGQTGFDFSFPGGADYSTLDAFAAAGLGAVTFAIRGYAGSDAPADPLRVNTEAGIEDLAAVLAWLACRGFERPHLVGWSWGGRIAGHYVQRRPEAIDRLVLLDPAIGGGQKIVPAPSDPWWVNRREDFLMRLVPEFSEPDGHAAFADHVALHEPRSPNGIRVENAEGSVAIDPESITRPTLMLYGDAAGRQDYMQGIARRADFFELLSTGDKALITIPGAGDYGHLERPRRRFHAAMSSFLRG